MKFIRFVFVFVFVFSSCSSKKDVVELDKFPPPYKLLRQYSKKIKPETDLILTGYGFNWCLPKGYEKKGIGNFSVSYKLTKTKNDKISDENARNLMVFLTENLLKEINTNIEVRPNLDVYPFSSDLVRIDVFFKDEDQVQLGQGVAIVYSANGKIKYEGYNIEGYRKPGCAYGKHYILHEESYAEALDIVKKQGDLRLL
jgi:hypothetical protein